MKVKEYIMQNTLRITEERLSKLEEISAPEVMIKAVKKQIEDIKNGIFNVGGDKDALDGDYVSSEEKKGRGGKSYIIINGNINYFPNAKYGRYIRWYKKGEENNPEK